MGCPGDHPNESLSFLAALQNKAAKEHIPLVGGIDLTNRCNFRCIHCYIADRTAEPPDGEGELSCAQWKRIIDDLAAGGCLYLLFTGGDPLVRDDFCEIYLHAKKRGLLVTVFTNGTNISASILATFREYPPHQVEISLYGASNQTYQAVTGLKNGFSRTIQTVDTLIEAGITVHLKTVLMTTNQDDFEAIEEIARERNVRFRYDPAIFPRLNGDRSITHLRVAPELVAELDFTDNARAEQWRDNFQKISPLPPSTNLYQCGSGVTSFHITAKGILHPCLMATHVGYDLRQGDFQYGWQEVLPEIKKRKASATNQCTGCAKKGLCNYCPPFLLLENGSENRPSAYLCAIAEQRYLGLRKK